MLTDSFKDLLLQPLDTFDLLVILLFISLEDCSLELVGTEAVGS